LRLRSGFYRTEARGEDPPGLRVRRPHRSALAARPEGDLYNGRCGAVTNMTKKPFQGTGTAMITPFKSDGSVDEKTLRRFVDFQIDGHVDMLLPCGTTGEGGTLDENETDRVVQIVIEQS